MKSVLRFAGDFIYPDNRKQSMALTIGEQGFDKMLKSYIILSGIIVTSMSAVALGPLRIFLMYRKWSTPLGVQFPLADVSDIAFYADLIIQVVIAFIGILTTVAIEMIQVIIINAVEISAVVIVSNIGMLGNQLNDAGKFSAESAGNFRNICIQIQDFNR